MLNILYEIFELSGLWKNTLVWPHDSPLIAFHNRKPDWLEGELWIYPGLTFIFQDFDIMFRASYGLPWWLCKMVEIDGKLLYPHEIKIVRHEYDQEQISNG